VTRRRAYRSAARSYWENGRAQALTAGQPPPPVKLPVAFITFPGEIFRAPRSWVEASYPTLTYFNEADRGGHFAAWEEPDVFTTEVRAAFKPLLLTTGRRWVQDLRPDMTPAADTNRSGR